MRVSARARVRFGAKVRVDLASRRPDLPAVRTGIFGSSVAHL